MPSRQELNLRARAVGIDPANYANDSKLEQRVIYEEKSAGTESGVAATGTLTSTGTAPADGDTVTIGERTYTFKTALSEDSGDAVPDEVLIGASAAAALDNLKLAINGGATEGTNYSTGTVAHEEVTAGTNTDTTQAVTSNEEGFGGNSIATTEDSTVLSWGAATLASGAPGTAAVDADDAQAVSGGARV